MVRTRPHLWLGLWLTVGCDNRDPTRCVGDGDPDLVVTPSLFDYPPLEDGARVPVYVPTQGGIFTELDFELSGVTQDEVGSLHIVIRLQGGEVVADTIPATAFDLACQADGSLLLELWAVGFEDDVIDVGEIETLDEREATLIVEIQLEGGLPPLNREFDVVLDHRTFN